MQNALKPERRSPKTHAIANKALNERTARQYSGMVGLRLSAALKRTVEDLSASCVCAANFRLPRSHSSGHRYFALKDDTARSTR